MSESIDWNRPIMPTPVGAPLWGEGEPIRPADRVRGIRDEQIRRAAILIKAAGGKPLTKATVRGAVARLAKEVPGLRYKFGVAIFSGLAPVSTLFGDDLPGKDVGRPQQWNATRRRWLAAEVNAIMKATPGTSKTDALQALIKRLAQDRQYPPSLKTLRNQLAKVATPRVKQ